MRREWIIDVLADLRTFAERNGLDATAAGLEDAALVAIAEIASTGRPRAVSDAVIDAEVIGYEGSNVTNLFAPRGRI